MKGLDPMRFALGFCVITTVLAGCSNSAAGTAGAPPMPQGLPSSTSQTAVSRVGSAVAIWATFFAEHHLFGLAANAKTLISIDTATQKRSCLEPLGLKIDAHQNVWVACSDGNGTSGGALQEYNSSGKQVAQYTSACPVSFGKNACKAGWSSGFTDGAFGGKNACGVTQQFEAKSSSSAFAYGTGFICWPLGKPSAHSTVTAIWSCTEPGGKCTGDVNSVGSAYWMDMDPKGNIWFVYQGGNSSCSGGGLGEVTDPGSPKAKVVILTSPCLVTYPPGGVYISNHGTVLNVIDETLRVVYQFHMPVTASSTPFRTLGPTETNGSIGQPISGAFNKSDSTMIISDGGCSFDVGSVAGKKNKWSTLSNKSFCPGSVGYTPSDK